MALVCGDNIGADHVGVLQAVMIPHYALLANVIQMAHYTNAKDESKPLEMQRYKPGSRVLGGKCVLR